MRSGSRAVTWSAAFLLAFQALTFAQSATTSLHGTISDAKGLVVAGANVTLSNAATGFSRSTKTDGQGVYQFLELPPATYMLTVEAAGFAKLKRENVVLQVSSPASRYCRFSGKSGSARGEGPRAAGAKPRFWFVTGYQVS